MWLGVGLAVLSVLAVPAAFVMVDLLGDRVQDRVQDRRQSELAEIATAPGDLVDQLQQERNTSLLEVLGTPARVPTSGPGVEERRGDVDRSIVDFEEAVLANEPATQAYDETLAALDDLEAIREAVDESSPRSFENLPAAHDLHDQYTQVISAVMDGTTRLAMAFDDADVRRGVDLIDLATRQTETVTVLSNHLMLAALEDGRLIDDQGNAVDRELTAEIGGSFQELRLHRSELVQLGTGKYEPATTKAVQDSDATGFEDLLLSIVDGEPYTINDVVTAIAPFPGAAYHRLRLDVEDLLRDS